MSQLQLIDPAPPPRPVPARTDRWKTIGDIVLYHGDCIDILARMPSNSCDGGVTDPPYGLSKYGDSVETFNPDLAQANARKSFQVGAGRMRNSTNPNLRGRSKCPAMSPSQIEYDRSLYGQRAFQRWTSLWAAEAFRVLKPGAYLAVSGDPRSAHRMICGLEDGGFEVCDLLPWLFAQGLPKSLDAQRAVDMSLCTLPGRHFMRQTPEMRGELGRPRDHVCPETREGQPWEGFGTGLKPGSEPIALVQKPLDGTLGENLRKWGVGALNLEDCRIATAGAGDRDPRDGQGDDIGRWPTNAVMDDGAAAVLDASFVSRTGAKFGPSRFYFVAKPSRAERDRGCGFNGHPTVKPIELNRWLLRLLMPPGGVVLEPFFGSGTTAVACAIDGYQCVAMEREERYLVMGSARVEEAYGSNR